MKKVYITPGRAGFRIFGDFKRGAYKMKIDARRDVASTAACCSRRSRGRSRSRRASRSSSFAASGRYLPRSAWNNLGIKHLNVDAVNLVVRQVPAREPRVLDRQRRRRRRRRAHEQRDPQEDDPAARRSRCADDDVARRRVDAAARRRRACSSCGSSASARRRRRACCSRTCRSSRRRRRRRTSRGSSASRCGRSTWTRAEPLDGVEVTPRAQERQDRRALHDRAASSGCTLDANADADPDQAEPFALIARSGDDLTYIRYKRSARRRRRVEHVGRAVRRRRRRIARRCSPTAACIGPGDTAHVVAIVRDQQGHARPTQALPIDVKLIDPRAKVVKKLTLQDQRRRRDRARSRRSPAFADTGHWRVALSVADKPLAVVRPAGRGVRARAHEGHGHAEEARRARRRQRSRSTSTRSYLFGGSAVDSGVELTCTIEPARFSPDGERRPHLRRRAEGQAGRRSARRAASSIRRAS